MATARVFRSGNSQAVRLPKEYRLRGTEVEIFRRGDEIVLREKAEGLVRAFEILAELSDDFLSEGRDDTPPQEREGLEWRRASCSIQISASIPGGDALRRFWNGSDS
jgi:antitoxin VapB